MEFLERQSLIFDSEEMDKITNATVLIGGVGGLGTHQALELQRVGVKKIYLIDYDRVGLSNLNRQILYGREDIGAPKVDKAKELLDSFGLGTEIITLEGKITKSMDLPPDVDIIFDALDNFEARLDLEEVATRYDLPLVHGGIEAWSGQITTIIPGRTVTLKELLGGRFRPKRKIPVFSPPVAIVASLQVIEGIKVLLGQEDILANKLLIVDLKDYSLEKIQL
ncbi:HesA/MoeB/ThiF family protein [Halonatronum saccharophilum]|uniref:HesA/MoeB/ThiF family protein n=1 Tax=Halonatronum saccharophilum TaxID=150060 RepID=UPI000487C68A|nr:ThiF family adenylyltransferase [Halonatronum saccharophilum]